MEHSSKNKVALSSRNQAELYFEAGNVGRAFAHFLVSLNLVPEWKDELRGIFSTTLCTWGRQLESQQRYTDLFNCYEQATEIFPENEEIFCNLGAHLFRLGHNREAAHYFHRALEINNNYLPAYRNLQNVCNALIERWHFRMLNDSYRNEAFREAITKKVQQGFSSVLDIGTGTGLLSLYAVTGGATDVHACDYSSTMCSIAQDVIDANKQTDNIILINKLSNDLKIPTDLPQRKSLVVTETMDCGLLGEHLLQTLVHAWADLLRPPCPQALLHAAIDSETRLKDFGIVLPFEASLWAIPVRSPTLARRNYVLENSNFKTSWKFENLWIYSDVSEPYDTENLKTIKDCVFLGEAVEVFKFDFNNPSELTAFYEGVNSDRSVSFEFEGKADVLAVWFDIKLDEDIVITSSPFKSHSQCCWDQAIFQLKKPQTSFRMQANCQGGRLKFEIMSDSFDELGLVCNNVEIAVTQEVVSYINSVELQEFLFTFPEQFSGVKNVLDLSPFPLLGLGFVKLRDANLVCILESEKEESALKEFMKINHIQLEKVNCLKKSEFNNILSNNSQHFDFIMNNIFERSGELSDTSINNILKLRNMLTPAGVLAPVSLTLMCQCVDSEWFSLTSRLINEELIETYKIAEFINIYKVSQQFDVDLKTVPFTALTEALPALRQGCDELARECLDREFSVSVTCDGSVTAVPVWFEYQLSDQTRALSTFTDTSHINQTVFIVDPPIPVKTGDSLNIHVTCYCGIFRIKLSR